MVYNKSEFTPAQYQLSIIVKLFKIVSISFQ